MRRCRYSCSEARFNDVAEANLPSGAHTRFHTLQCFENSYLDKDSMQERCTMRASLWCDGRVATRMSRMCMVHQLAIDLPGTPPWLPARALWPAKEHSFLQRHGVERWRDCTANQRFRMR